MKNKVLNLLSLIFLISLASCGFKPLYAGKGKGGSSSCNNFVVNEINLEEIGQKLRYKLQDNLNHGCIGDKNYQINVNLASDRREISVQKDREITRYNAILRGDYSLVSDGKVIYSDSSKMIGGFDAVISDYGTYAQEEDAFLKLAEEMANDIGLKVASRLKQ